MEDLDDLSPSKLRQISEDWAALAYVVRNSFIHDPDFEEMIMGTAWADDFIAIKDCSEAATNTEDLVLNRGWLTREVERSLSDDNDIE